jgi:hypothetical protein
MKLVSPLPPYPSCLLIVELFQINHMLIRLEDCSIFNGPSLTPFHLLQKSQTSLLLNKY